LVMTIRGPASRAALPSGPLPRAVFPALVSLRIRLHNGCDDVHDAVALKRFFGAAEWLGGLELLSSREMRQQTEPLSVGYTDFLCGFQGLRYLRINLPILGLPACLSELTQLVSLTIGSDHEFRGPEALPGELASLQGLLEFVAFKEGTNACPPAREPLRHMCKPSFQSGWRCPSLWWRLRFDDTSAPWWKWRTLRIFWVDSNWFYGHIPDFLPEAWPELRKLDLYDNSLEGPVPATLGRIPHLGWMQLNHNNLSGELPTSIFDAPRVGVKLVGNPLLTGCVPKAPREHLALMGFPCSVDVSAPGHPGAITTCSEMGTAPAATRKTRLQHSDL